MTAQAFFNEFNKLIANTPKLPDKNFQSEDLWLSDNAAWCKNLYSCFDLAKSSNCAYIFNATMCDNCFDCDHPAECQLCYECTDTVRCYNCLYLNDCADLRDSWYSYACNNCHDIFGCLHLKNKSFCLFNRQLTEVEYKEKITSLIKLPAEKILKILEGIELKYPRTQTFEDSNENSEYDNYVYRCKNCYLCFDIFRDENCGYLFNSSFDANCFDFSYAFDSELSYEAMDCSKIFNCNYIYYASSCRDSNYIFDCLNVDHCLGCVHLTNKKYCILNRQFSKEDYEKISAQILSELNKQYLGWGNINFR